MFGFTCKFISSTNSRVLLIGVDLFGFGSLYVDGVVIGRPFEGADGKPKVIPIEFVCVLIPKILLRSP